jgi:hypothetical protein
VNQKIETGMEMANSDLVRLSTDTDEQWASQNQSSGEEGGEKMHNGQFVSRRGEGKFEMLVDESEMIVQMF